MIKRFSSPNYNYTFNTENGNFARWGKTFNDDPDYSPFGPEILDIEISTVCHKGCSFCYKSNTSKGRNMSLALFKEILKKMPTTVTQIAFGIGSIDGNPELWDILDYTRSKGIVPNITINGSRMTVADYGLLEKYCGAVAVSHYQDDECFNAVQELTDRGMEQVNIHALLSRETYHKCIRLMRDSLYDERLKKLNAIVFLWLKPKGQRNKYSPITQIQYEKLVDFALKKGIKFGFDSCSAPMFVNVYKRHSMFDPKVLEMVESCESTRFSAYCNVEGLFYPCSFAEGLELPVNILSSSNFWKALSTVDFRKRCINNKDQNDCHNCVLYDLKFNEDLL